VLLDGGQRVSVITGAVHLGVKEMGCKQGTGIIQIGLQVGMRAGTQQNHCRAIKEELASHKNGNRL